MLILASQSAARNALLAGAGVKFESRPAPIDERRQSANARAAGSDARAIARKLAEAKALTVAAQHPRRFVIGADQILECGGQVLHKVNDLAAAVDRLLALRGRPHHLHSGIALVRDGRVLWSEVETASLSMRAFEAAELETVLALEGDAILASVGCYRLEGPSIRLFESIAGDYFTILGLPLLPLLSALRQHAPELL